MALNPQASFSAGELDPALRERTTLGKYNTGLATARNVYIAKSGRICTRASRQQFLPTKLANRKVIIHPMGAVGSFVEFGHLYLRIYTINPAWTGVSPTATVDYYVEELTHFYTEDQLSKIQFADATDGECYVFCEGQAIGYLTVNGTTSGKTTAITGASFGIPPAPTLVSNTVGGTGYDLDYAVSFVIAGEESAYTVTATGKMPITTGTSNTIIFKAVGFGPNIATVSEMKVYRRPRNGGAYGFVGTSSQLVVSGSDVQGTYIDLGSEADYTNSPPGTNITISARGGSGPNVFGPRTGVIYQQRLLVSSYTGIEASRTGHQNNFYQDFPISDDSSLSFKAGASGNAAVLFMAEMDGLNVFTSKGLYYNAGALTPSNLALEKKGRWVIDRDVPPIQVPGGLLFVDSTSNVIRRLVWSNEQQGYLGQELSIYSDHLFSGKKIVSWAFQDGEPPLLWVVFSDGTFASFTYEPDQEMRAWTRHDSQGVIVEYVAGMVVGRSQWFQQNYTQPYAIFVVNKGGQRYIEITNPRFVSGAVAVADPESDKSATTALMDAIVTWKNQINQYLVGTDVFTLTPVVAGIWDGALTLTCGTSGIFTSGGLGAIGRTFRHFDLVYGDSVDLVITARASNNSVTVMPTGLYPSTQATGMNLYQTANVVTGIDHLEGEAVSVMVDGYVIASPNNDSDNLPVITVNSGFIVLPTGVTGAIIHVGRPVTADAETLDIATVEQRPILIESKTVNKVYMKSYRSRGMFVGPRFPSNNKVIGTEPEIPMQDVDKIQVNYQAPFEVIGNRFQPPETKRSEITLPGDWDSNGRVCARQVDPVHFEILSIIPDLDDERR